MTNLSIRFDDQLLATLDKLVIATRAYYESQANQIPAFAAIAQNTTRSSALRDLLLAWDHGKANELFSREITKPISDGA
jgi:predicted transcriptional regulator